MPFKGGWTLRLFQPGRLDLDCRLQPRLSQVKTNTPLYVQYGCGLSAPAGWLNFDSSPTLRFERLPLLGKLYTRNACRFPENVMYGDVVKGLPVEVESCDGVYCSHVLEHLALEDFRQALRNTFKMLKPGGTFRLVLPDLEHYIKVYQQSSSPTAAHVFMRETCLGQERRPRSLKAWLVSWLGGSQHFWMWDFKAMQAELKEAGFTDIRRASFGDSANVEFAAVEDRGRWDDNLGVECRRPA